MAWFVILAANMRWQGDSWGWEGSWREDQEGREGGWGTPQELRRHRRGNAQGQQLELPRPVLHPQGDVRRPLRHGRRLHVVEVNGFVNVIGRSCKILTANKN